MNDLDPNYLLPLWQAVIAYFRKFPPLVHNHRASFNPSLVRQSSLDILSSRSPHAASPLVQADQLAEPRATRRARI